MAPNLKKPNIEHLISSPNLNDSIIELDDYICALCGWGDDISALSHPQMVFYLNQELEREINNGGFDQYFHNSSGKYASDTIASLTLIGATKMSKILESAIGVFPDNHVPIDKGSRNDLLEDIRDKAADIWDELEQQFTNMKMI